MKLVIFAVDDRVSFPQIAKAMKNVGKTLRLVSDIKVLEEDLKIRNNERSQFEEAIEAIIKICGDPSKNAVKFTMKFWTKFTRNTSDKELTALAEMIVNEYNQNEDAREYVDAANGGIIVSLCKAVLDAKRS